MTRPPTLPADRALSPVQASPFPRKGKRAFARAFSLIEVVIALGIFSFAIVAILGLFTVSLQTSRESEGEIQAASVASMLVAIRKASPTNAAASLAIPVKALNQDYGPAYAGQTTSYVGLDGSLTNAAAAAYRITCRAGTNSVTGTGLAQVYLMLSWPPQADAASLQAGRYEVLTQIPNR